LANASGDASGGPLLEVRGLDTRYDFLQVLWDVSLRVDEGEFVALIGPNGAGKSTTLKTVAGLLQPSSGDIVFRGRSIAGVPAHSINRMGISFISEALNLFPDMSVRENLLLGAYTVHDRAKEQRLLDFVLELFPRLAERQGQLAGTLSGGERKMLAVARGMMSSPELLLVDEPSLGLAPQLVLTVFNALQTLRDQGVTILLVEQNVNTTLQITDRAYVLENGRITMHGASGELLQEPHVRQAYLGVA
jgi:ABC-type branched-subunit amino acid transport system ATPase component